jgi:hypothetical protein
VTEFSRRLFLRASLQQTRHNWSPKSLRQIGNFLIENIEVVGHIRSLARRSRSLNTSHVKLVTHTARGRSPHLARHPTRDANEPTSN